MGRAEHTTNFGQTIKAEDFGKDPAKLREDIMDAHNNLVGILAGVVADQFRDQREAENAAAAERARNGQSTVGPISTP